MVYSRKRLIIIAIFWIAAGAAFTALAPQSTYFDSPQSLITQAQDDSNCYQGSQTGPPCQFPTSSNTGGIVLGTSYLNGVDLATWLRQNGAEGNDDGAVCNDWGGEGACILTANAPGRSDSIDTQGAQGQAGKVYTAGVGLNQIDPANNFYAYKAWQDTENGQEFATYFYLLSDQATLDGTSTCGSENNGSIAFGRVNCDLFVEVSEFATSEFDAQGSTFGININLNEQDYWLSRPHLDQCDPLGGFFPDLNNACLGAVESGSRASGLISNINLNLYGLTLLTHRASAVPATDTSPPTNKILDLENVYLEMRYGKGSDRALYPDNANQSDASAPIVLQPGVSDRLAGISQPFECRGNPSSDGINECPIHPNRLGQTGEGNMYEDIHR